MGVFSGTPKIFGYPLLSQELQILPDHSQCPSEQNPIKNFGKRERGHTQGLAKCFGYPLLSRERVKLQTSIFVGIFIGSVGTKAH